MSNGTAALPLIMDDAEVEIDGKDLKCLTNHVELFPDVANVELTTFCDRRDYPGTIKWLFRATFYQSFEANGTHEVLKGALAKATVPFKVRPTSKPVSATNPSFEGEMVPKPYPPIMGDAGAASEVEIEWSMTGPPVEITTPASNGNGG